jgi:prophage regulatory protein
MKNTPVIVAVIPAEGFVRVSQLLGKRGVPAILPISRTELYRQLRSGRFPQPLKIGKRSIAWPAAQVRSMIAELEAQQP